MVCCDTTETSNRGSASALTVDWRRSHTDGNGKRKYSPYILPHTLISTQTYMSSDLTRANFFLSFSIKRRWSYSNHCHMIVTFVNQWFLIKKKKENLLWLCVCVCERCMFNLTRHKSDSLSFCMQDYENVITQDQHTLVVLIHFLVLTPQIDVHIQRKKIAV